MSRKLRFGIVGCGGIATEHLRACQTLSDVEVAWVFDTVKTSAQSFANLAGAQVANSVQQMAESGDLDAVSICTPPAMHLENAQPFLTMKVPILCEKPLAASLPEARVFAEAVQRSRSLFMTAFCHRFHGPILELRNLIRSGRLGESLYFRNIFGGFSDFRGNHRTNPAISGGGCIIDNGTHAVDLFRFLVGEPMRVQAMAGNVLQHIPIEDMGMIQLSIKDRIFGEITVSYSLKGCGNWVEWYGTKGRATVSYWNPNTPELAYLSESDTEWISVDCSKHPDRFTAEIGHFFGCVRSGERPLVTVADGLRANQLIAAAYQSVKLRRTVAVPTRTKRK